ncbi:MAG: hypothetical protein AAGB48_00185 [Planctomycetota bacterium]
MLLTLHAASVRGLLAPSRGKPKLTLSDLPKFARQELDMNGLNLTTDLLKGATRSTLEALRETADKQRCACLLLIEPEPLRLADESDEVGGQGVDRAKRVLTAASLLGCNAAAIGVESADEDDFVDFAADRFRQIVETADKLDMSILIAPREGLTKQPERVTELIKKVGGFRVGTLPDFAEAVQADDPAAYLRKLVPYASVVCATTVELTPAEPSEDNDAPQANKRGAQAENAEQRQPPAEAEPTDAEPTEAELADDEEQLEASMAAEAGEDAAALDPSGGPGGGLESLINAVLNEQGLEPEEDPPVHSPYDLQPLIDAVHSVGFDGSLAVRYSGTGDPVVGTDLSRWALDHAIEVAKG